MVGGRRPAGGHDPNAHLVVGDLEEVVEVAAAEFVLDVGGNGQLPRGGDRTPDAEPQALGFLLHPVQGPEVPQVTPLGA